MANLSSSYEQISSVCRGCLATERRMIKATRLEAVFKDLTGILISPTDGLPQWLCYECSALLHKYNRFRTKVLRSHSMLCQYVQQSVPFEADKSQSHLSCTNVQCYEILSTQAIQLQKQTNTIYYESDTLSNIIETESVEVKDEPMSSDYEDNILEEENREENEDDVSESKSWIHKPIVVIGDVKMKHEEQMAQPEALSQEPHGTEAAQQHVHKHVDASGISRYLKARQYPADTSSRHSDNTEEEAKYNINEDDSVNSSSRSNIQSYICDACNKCFNDKNLLITHIRNSRKGYLNQHMRVHVGDMPYKSDVCLKLFSQKPNFKNNMWVHTGDESYKCEVSMKRFTQKKSLSRHLRAHTGDKPYKCDVCMKCFGNKQNLGIHMRIHTGDKPYKCNICMKCFSQQHHLQMHMRIHTGDKPYKCDICMKCFGQKSHLQVHMRIHTGDKPYKCEVCMKRFSQRQNLQKHNMRIHIGDKPYKC